MLEGSVPVVVVVQRQAEMLPTFAGDPGPEVGYALGLGPHKAERGGPRLFGRHLVVNLVKNLDRLAALEFLVDLATLTLSEVEREVDEVDATLHRAHRDDTVEEHELRKESFRIPNSKSFFFV